jgi:predicted oxidoreductase
MVLDAGARHFDVAPQYGLGTAEAVLGRALRGRRDEVTIATKVGILRPQVPIWKLSARTLVSPVRTFLRARRWVPEPTVFGGLRQLDHSPAQIIASLEESLRFLRTDRVDLFLLHMPRRSDVTEEVVNTLQVQKSAGKALAIGLATDRDETTLILQDWPNTFDAVQYSWSALDAQLLPAAGAEPFLITHRAIARAFCPLSEWCAAYRQRIQRLSKACAADMANPAILSQTLIGAAMAANTEGMVLVASRSIVRSCQNVKAALAPETLRLGSNFLAALKHEPNLPEPRR